MGSSSLSAPAKAPAHSPSTRGSSPRSPPCRRPKLMRSSATAPSVVISTASRNDLSSYNPMSMASTLLSRVASYSGPRQDQHSGLCPPSNRHKSASPRRRSPHSREASRRRGTGDIHRDDQLREPVGYFSFPDFEDFLEETQEGEGFKEIDSFSTGRSEILSAKGS